MLRVTAVWRQTPPTHSTTPTNQSQGRAFLVLQQAKAIAPQHDAQFSFNRFQDGLESDKKDSLNKHVVSSGHLHRKEEQKTHGLKRQLSITEVCDKQKKAKTEKLVLIDYTVKMCFKANFPINKLDHPAVREYLKKHIPGFGDLPCGRNLQPNFV
ncbi:unnamed protein product [Timema podura]|uniref:Uncharacterized protein n=1 Tax=Timema podura TaxID=61482 RepID=A0ABN7P2B5_TIMPD|nr:unnamed protein product [Timema podura]